MKDQYADTCRISVYADDANGALSRILQLFSKSRFEINYIQVFDMADENLKLIIVDASFPEEMMSLMLNRIEKILEVHRAVAHVSDKRKQFIGLFTVPSDFLDTVLCDALKNRGVQLNAVAENMLVLQLIGHEEDIKEVHRLLSDAVSTGFYKGMWPDITGLPMVSTKLYDRTGSSL
jgi:acetolactate synthase small subunit